MSSIYPLYKGAMAIQAPTTNLIACDVRVQLFSSAYVYSDAHQFLSDITGGVIASDVLTGKSLSTIGAFDSDNVVLLAVTGAQVVSLALYIDTGTPATSRLVMYQDSGATGLPFTPNGSDVTLAVDPSGWFTF